MENEKKFVPSRTVVARVIGDVEAREGKNGKAYRIVPIEFADGGKSYAFCNGALELGSYVTVLMMPRNDNLSYRVCETNIKLVSFLSDALCQWYYLLDEKFVGMEIPEDK